VTGWDPATLEILWSRLVHIADECWVTIARTAFSTIVGEAGDFACEILDGRGESIAHSPRSMPVFNLTLPRAVKALLSAFPPESLEEGDVLITNDPWMCAGHLFDVAIVTPVYRAGRLVGLVGSIAHWSDIGGTKDPGHAREIYEEGLQIPPVKLYRAGRRNEDLVALIRRNVRNPEMVFGDLQAQVASNHVGAQRLLAFLEEVDLQTLEPLAEEVQRRAEIAMRQAIRSLPDGTYRSRIGFELMGRPASLGCEVRIEGEELTVDWVEAPPEQPVGALNCTYSYTAAHTVYALKCLLTPQIPSNAGCFRPLRVRAPLGSVLNCRYPVATSQRTLVGWLLAPALFASLQEVVPDRVQAFSGLPASVSAYGYDASGNAFHDHIMFGGGQGAGRFTDGRSALMFPTSAGNVPVEMFEQRTPILVERKELIPDSGGPGAHRGGLGQRVVLRKLADDGRPVLLHILTHAVGRPVPGLLGGEPGRDARVWCEGTASIGRAGASILVELCHPDQRVVVETAGGSGFGDPGRRAREAIERDLEEGYVTSWPHKLPQGE